MKNFFSFIAVGAMLLLCSAPLTFTSCENEHPEVVTIPLASDYSGIIDAINDVNSTLTEKLETIQSAVAGGSLEEKQALELIQQALETLNGTLDEKLGAIKDAIGSQTTSLEMKLDLIYGALNTGLTDANGALGLIKDAILSLKDSISGDEGLIKKIDEIVASLGDIDTTLTDDVAKALQDILGAMPTVPDYSDLLEAIQKAIEELGPGYDFLHLSNYTFNTGHENKPFIQKLNFDTNDGSVVWWTQVNPKYLTGDGDESFRHALKKYGVSPLNLAELAFNVVDRDDEIMSDEEIDAAGLKVRFTFADASLGSQPLPEMCKVSGTYETYDDLFLDPTVFYYNTKDKDFIRLKGEIKTKEGGKIRTRFDRPKASVKYPEEVLDYSTFALVPWKPFKEITLANDTYTIVLDEHKIYAVSLAEVTGLTLKDSRPQGVTYYVMNDGEWMIGNVTEFDSEAGTYTKGGNGYVYGVSSREAYSITPVASATVDLTELKKIIGVKYSADGVTFSDKQKSDGSLMPYFVVDYTSEIQFRDEAEIPMTITFESPWQDVSAECTIIVTGVE